MRRLRALQRAAPRVSGVDSQKLLFARVIEDGIGITYVRFEAELLPTEALARPAGLEGTRGGAGGFPGYGTPAFTRRCIVGSGVYHCSLFGDAERSRGARRCVQRDVAAALRYRRGQNQARRLHRAREPQLRRSLSWLSRRGYRVERQEHDGPNDQTAADPVEPGYEIDHSASGDVRRVQRNREAARNGLSRWTDSIASSSTAVPSTDSTDTCRTTRQNRTSTWRTSGFLADKMFASQLDESFVAHQYIIAAQAKSSVDVPDFYWGAPAAARRSRDASRTSAPSVSRSAPVSTTRRSATSSTTPVCHGVSIRANTPSRSAGSGRRTRRSTHL